MELAEQVMVALGERDVAVAAAERKAGASVRQLIETEGLSVSEAVEWCGGTLTLREVTRLRRLVDEQGATEGSNR